MTGAPTQPLVLITGASSGIGQALAQQYASRGYRLALVARGQESIENWLRTQPISLDSYQTYSADVTQLDSLSAMAQACLKLQGLPDVVIANAGISIGVDTSLPDDIAVMQQILSTNVLGVAATFQPFIALMRARGTGTLVGIGSVAGIRGLPGHGAYCASKAAVISYCESLRGELRSSGVNVVTICPGYVATPLTQKNAYSMPFLMPADLFAERAIRAISSGASYRVIPWQMGIVAKLLRVLPNALFDRLLNGRPRKSRHSSL
jgi:short-subunit dehydrogenase